MTDTPFRRPVPPAREEVPEAKDPEAVPPVRPARGPTPFRTPTPPRDPDDHEDHEGREDADDPYVALLDLTRRHLTAAVRALEAAHAAGDEEALGTAVADLQALDDQVLSVLPDDGASPAVAALRRAVVVIGDQVGGLVAAVAAAREARVDAVRRALADA